MIRSIPHPGWRFTVNESGTLFYQEIPSPLGFKAKLALGVALMIDRLWLWLRD